MGVSEMKDRADYRLGEWTVRPSFNAMFRNGCVERLEPQIMNVLNFLAANSGRVVSREELIDQCWGGLAVTDDAVTRCISRLRNVFRQSGDDPAIETIPKRGYCLRSGSSRAEPEPDDAATAFGPASAPAATASGKPKLWVTAGIALALAAAAVAIGLGLPGPARPSYAAEPRPLTSEPGPERWPSYSPDGAHIAYVVSDRDRTRSAVFVRAVDGSGSARRISPGGYRHRSVNWSPSGSRIAYISELPAQPCRIMIVAANGGEAREVGRCRSSEIGWVDWMSEDDLVVADGPATGWGMSLFRLSITDGKRRQLTRGDGETMGDRAPHAGGAGGQIAFLRSASLFDTSILLVDPGTGRTALAGGGFNAVYGFDWEPGGTSLLVSGSRGGGEVRLWRVAKGRAPVEVAASEARLSRLNVGPDGHIAFERETEIQNLVQVPTAGKAGATMLDPSSARDRDAAYSPNGRSIALITDRSGKLELWVLEGGRRRQLTRLEPDEMATFGWDPAGEQILISTLKGAEMELSSVRVADGMVRSLLKEPMSGMSAAWGPGGRSIYFSSSRDGAARIWSMDLTTRQMSPVTGPGLNLVRTSPDGRWFYVSDGRTGRIWRHPAAGGPRQLALDVKGADPWVWIPTDRGLFFLEPDARGRMTVKRRDLASGGVRTIETPDISAFLALAVRDDEAAVIVPQSTISEVDLQMLRPSVDRG
jgi:DNA-binding winged helix-turn-helix (wHTH) protein